MSVYEGYYTQNGDNHKEDDIGTIVWPTLPDLPKIKRPHLNWRPTKSKVVPTLHHGALKIQKKHVFFCEFLLFFLKVSLLQITNKSIRILD